MNFIPFDRLTAPLRGPGQAALQPPGRPLHHRAGEDGVELIFDTPQRAVTPGQAAVFYDGPLLLGGGTITAGSRV